jgi:hypothetical protein
MEIEFKVCVSITFKDSAERDQFENDQKFDKAISTILGIVTPVTVGLIPSTALISKIAKEGSIALRS